MQKTIPINKFRHDNFTFFSNVDFQKTKNKKKSTNKQVLSVESWKKVNVNTNVHIDIQKDGGTDRFY